MTLVEHLEELRRRLIVVVARRAGRRGRSASSSRGEVIAPAARPPARGAPHPHLHWGRPTPSAPQLKIAGFLGIAFAMPVILYEIWRFVTPGPHPARERRLVWPVVVARRCSCSCWACGIGYLVIPYTLNFLLDFSEGIATPLPDHRRLHRLRDDHDAGLRAVLEFPIVLIGLARVGILNYRRLASRRRWAILAIVRLRHRPHPRRRPDLAARSCRR